VLVLIDHEVVLERAASLVGSATLRRLLLHLGNSLRSWKLVYHLVLAV